MNSQELLFKTKGNDEAYTPNYGVKPILKYIETYRDSNNFNNLIVWCPFDTDSSEFVKQIKLLKNVTVINSHIDDGKDFFEYEPPKWDVIISNPPFKNKRKFFEKALSFKKPFALIMTNTWLNDSAPMKLFKKRGLQLLLFTKRMQFNNPYGNENKKITFGSSYYCWNFLPEQIIIEDFEND